VDGDDATDVCSNKSLRLIRRSFRIPVTDPFFSSAATLSRAGEASNDGNRICVSSSV
jgi:hypothetical protein